MTVTDTLLADAHDRLNLTTAADDILRALTSGEQQASITGLTDDNAPDVWTAVAARLTGHQHSQHARTAEAGLRDLHTRLRSLLERVRRTPAAEPMDDLVQQYIALRAAQRALCTTYAGRSTEVEFSALGGLRVPLHQLLRVAGDIANIDALWPAWRSHQRGKQGLPPPWEHDDRDPVLIDPTPANLRWLAGPDVQAWVPTLAQAAEALVKQTQAEEKRYLGRAVQAAG